MTASDKINILIVEDNEDHLFFIKKALSDENYALQHIVSGTEAYNYLLNPKIKPDVVLLDNHLPGMSGLEILKKLGTKTKDYGFIVTTVDKDPEIIVDSMRLGALDFSPKTPEYFYILPQRIDKVYKILKDKIEKQELKKVLKTQQKALETAEKMAKLGSFTLDLLTYKGQISKAFKTITGFKENRTIDFHKDWRRIVHPEDVSGNQKVLEKALKTGVFNHTYRIITLDTHQIKWIHSLGKVIYKNKKPISFIGAIQDVTSQKQAQRKILEAERRWKIALEGTSDGLWDVNLVTKEVFYSKEWKSLLGYKDHEIENKVEVWEDLVHPDDLRRVKAHSELHIKGEISNFYNEYRMRCKDGSYKWILDRGKVIERDIDGKPLRMMGIHSDITERKNLENSLFTKNQFLTHHLNQTPLAAIYVDVNMLIKEWNLAAENIFGYTAQEALGKNVFNLLVPKDILKKIKPVGQNVLNEIGSTHQQNKNKTKDGKEIICNWFNSAIKDENNTVIGIVSLVEDVTEHIQAEKTLKESEQKLQEAQKIAQLGHFVYDSLTKTFETSQILDDIVGVNKDYTKDKSRWINLCHPDDLIKVTAIFNSPKAKNISKEFRLIRYNDKKIIWVLVTIKEAFDKNTQKRTKITGTVQDITERKEIEHNLFTKNQFLTTHLNQTPLATIYVGIDMIVKEWNEAATNIFGYTADEAIGKNLFNLVVPDDIFNEIDTVRQNVLNELSGSHYQNRNKTKNGKEIICDWFNSVIKDENDKIVGVTCLAEDVTNKVRLEKTIKEIEKSITLKVGKEYYITISKELNKILIADYIIIAKHDKKENTCTTLSYLNKQKVLKNVTYSLANTPCRIVLKEGYGYYTKEVTKIFNTDKYLIENKIEAYVGVAIYNSDQKIIGLLVAMFCKPITEERFYKTIFRLLADKIGAEMERNTLVDKLFNKQTELLKAQEIAQLGTFDLDFKTNTFKWSDIVNDILGLKPNDSKTLKAWENILNPEDVLENEKRVRESIKTGKKYDYTYRIKIPHKKNTFKWIHALGQIVFKDGKATNLVGTVQDVTKTKSALNALDLSQKKFKNLFELNPISLWEEDFYEVKKLLLNKQKKVKNLKTYLDKNEDFVFECLRKLKILNVNKASLKLFKITDKNQLINHLNTTFNKESFRVFKEELLAIAKNVKEFKAETEFVKSDGSLIFAMVKMVMKSDNRRIIFSIIDITAQKQLQLALLDSQVKLEEAHKITRLGTFTLDDKTGLFKTSDICDEIIGLNGKLKKDIAGWRKIVHLDDHERLHQIFDDTIHKNITEEFRIVRPKDQKIIWVLVHIKKVFNNQGSRVFLTGTVQDITRRKKTEIALFEKSQFLNKTFSYTPLAFVYFDTNSIIRMWNPAAERIFGYTAKEAVGKNVMDLIVPKEIHHDLKKVRDAVLQEDGSNININENITKSGIRILCKWHNSEIKDAQNNVIGLAALAEDITKQTHLENIIKGIEKSISFKTGKDYYVTLAKELNKGLKADYIVIGLYDKNTNTNTTLSHLLKNKTLPNTVFDLKNTACERVIKEGYFYQNKDIIKSFTVDPILQKAKVNAYMGVAIYNSDNECVGSIGAMFCKPIAEEETFKILMQFFAYKIASELERNTLIEQLYTSSKELEKVQNIANLGSYILDISTSNWQSSPILNKIFGIKKSYIKDISSWLDIVHPEDRNKINNYFANHIIKKGHKFDKEYRIIRVDNKQERWVHGLGKLEYDNKGVLLKMIGTIQDITARKNIEQNLLTNQNKLKESSRLLTTLSQMNVAIALENDRTVLFKKICDIAVEIGKFKMAWIGIVDRDSKTVKPIASSGKGVDYLKDIKISINNDKTSKGPTGRCIIEKRSIIFNDFKKNKDYEFWAKSAVKRGYHSSAAIPILLNNTAIGAINLYSNDSHYFNKEEIEIIEKSVMNISLALGKFEEQEALKISKQNLLEAQKIAQLGTYNLDFKAKTFSCSPILEKIIGIKPTDPRTLKAWRELLHPEDILENQKRVSWSIKTGQKFDFEYRILVNDKKELKWIHALGQIVYKDGKPSNMVGTVQDITESKLAEQKLKQSDAVLKRLDSLVIVGGLGGDIKFVSPNVEKLLGYKPSELLVQGWWQKTFDNKRNAKASKNMLDKFILENVAFKEEFNLRKVKTKKGAYKWIEWHPSVGENNTFISIGIDITKRKKEELTKEVIYNITKKANEALPQELFYDFIRLELGKLINTTNFYIALGNKESEYLTVPYMHDEKDRKSDFPKRDSLSGYVIDIQKSLLINNLNKKILEQGPMSKCWLGTPLIINNNVIGVMTVQSYTDENAYTQDDVTLLELVASNISQVIGKSQDLERINLLSHALTQSAEAVIITDVDGAIQYVNPGFSALSGYTEQEALGQNPRIIKSGDQAKAYYEKLWNTILSGDNWQGEFVNKRKDGTKYLVNANISPIKNKEGIITHFVGVQEDITEKRKLERDLIHAFIDAQEEEKISFGEDLHDGISQILSAEAMFIQVLIQQNKDVLNAQSLKYLESVKDLNIKAINEARSIAHGLMSKQLKENGLLKAVAHICKDYNGSKNIVFQYTHKGLKETDIAKAIKINIFRIIQEISTNTIRHSGAKKVEISLSKTQNNMLQLIYSDNGVGIDFEKMKQEKKGAGLKNIERRVTLLKGTYTLNSLLNKGVKYTIEVPLFNI